MRTMKLTVLSVMLALIIWVCQANPEINVYLIGDSTMADKPVDDNPERGWGQVFQEFFTENVHIHNHARNGRSTKSFIDQGLWQQVLDSLDTGDYVMIQFGHNDQKIKDSTRYTEASGDYRTNLIRYVNETRSKGAIPVLLTPLVRRRFDAQGKFYDTHGAYPQAVRDVAHEMNVALVDAHQLSMNLVQQLGEEDSKEIYLWVEPGQYKRFPEGKQDNTHFSEYGAQEIATLISEDLKNLDLDLKNWLIEYVAH